VSAKAWVIALGDLTALLRGVFDQRIQLRLETDLSRSAMPTPCGERRGFTANCSSSGSTSARPRLQNTWRRRRPSSQGWKTLLRNHADGIASIDLFVVPTISFRLLVLRHSRRELLWLVGRNGTSKCRMDCPSINRGLRLE